VSPQVLQQTERQFERAVVEYAELRGWMVYHTFDSRRSNPGFPDLVMVRDGKLVFAELKSQNGRVSRSQGDWLEALDGVAGWPIDKVDVFVWRPSDWTHIEETLR
jgi:hypothetical protein